MGRTSAMHRKGKAYLTGFALAAALPSPTVFAAPPPLEAYGELPAVEDVAISPSGNSIASVTRFGNARRLLILDIGGKPKIDAAVGDIKVRGIQFAGDEMVLLNHSATSTLGPGFTADLYEFHGTLIVPLKGGKAEQVFSRTRRIGGAVFGRYGVRRSADGNKGYFGGVELRMDRTGPTFVHGRPTLYEVDLASNSARKLAQPGGEGHSRDWLVGADGRVAATMEITGSSGTWSIEGTGRKVIASGVDHLGGVELVSLGKDGSTVIYSATDRNDSSHWYEVPLAGGEAREILANVNIGSIFTDRDTGYLLGYVTDDAQPVPVMYDHAKQAAMSKVYKAFRKYRFSLVDWTPDFAKVIVLRSGSDDSGTYYLVDVAALKADPLGYERPGIAPEDVGPVSAIDYQAADGLKMDGILTLPPGREARNLPVIMLPHGGPHAHDQPVFDWWAQAFASRGYAVFQPNFRGSTNRDDAFRTASTNEWGRKMQTDISDGLAELAKRGIVDPKRACIMGASYGGYAALAGVTLQQGIYRCAVAVAPVADLETMYNTELRESGGSRMLSRVLRDDLGDPKGYDAVSPKKHASKADAPILLIHGKDDTVVPFRHSDAMAGALRGAGKPYELVILKHEDHWLSTSDTRLQMLTEAMRFVQKYNPAD